MHQQEWAGEQEGGMGGEYHHNTLYACVKPSEIKKKESRTSTGDKGVTKTDM